MAIPLVEIVNSNGRKGLVAETSKAASVLKRSPSTRSSEPESQGDEMPARNASAEAWRSYATTHGMSSDDADQMGRDQLVAHYTSEED